MHGVRRIVSHTIYLMNENNKNIFFLECMKY